MTVELEVISEARVKDLIDKLPGRPINEVLRNTGLRRKVVDEFCTIKYGKTFSELRLEAQRRSSRVRGKWHGPKVSRFSSGARITSDGV